MSFYLSQGIGSSLGGCNPKLLLMEIFPGWFYAYSFVVCHCYHTKKKKVVIDLVAIASFYFSQAYSTYPLWRNFKLSSYFGKRLLACSLFNKLLETTLLPQLISLLH